MVLQGAEVLFYPTAIGSEPQDHGLDSRDHWKRVMQGHAGANVVCLEGGRLVSVLDSSVDITVLPFWHVLCHSSTSCSCCPRNASTANVIYYAHFHQNTSLRHGFSILMNTSSTKTTHLLDCRCLWWLQTVSEKR